MRRPTLNALYAKDFRRKPSIRAPIPAAKPRLSAYVGDTRTIGIVDFNGNVTGHVGVGEFGARDVRGWNVVYRCAHCEEFAQNHAEKGDCLFSPTKFRAMTEAEAVVFSPHVEYTWTLTYAGEVIKEPRTRLRRNSPTIFYTTGR